MNNNPRIDWYNSVENIFKNKKINYLQVGDKDGLIYKSGKFLIQDIWIDKLFDDVSSFIKKAQEGYELFKYFTFFHTISLFEENTEINLMEKHFTCYTTFIYSKEATIIIKTSIDKPLSNSHNEEDNIIFRNDFLIKEKNNMIFTRDLNEISNKNTVDFILRLKKIFNNVFSINLKFNLENDYKSWIDVNKNLLLNNKISNIFESENKTFYIRENNSIFKELTFKEDYYFLFRNLLDKILVDKSYKNTNVYKEKTFLIDKGKRKKDYEPIQKRLCFFTTIGDLKFIINLDRYYFDKNLNKINPLPSPNQYYLNYIVLKNDEVVTDFSFLSEEEISLFYNLKIEYEFLFFDFFN